MSMASHRVLHMVPNGDQPTAELQSETFTLANMIPQDADNNEVLWEGVESAVRDVARKYGEVYVVTGPIFQGNSIQRLNNRVLIPTNLFKAFYVPSRQMAGVYVAANAPGMAYQSISLDQLKQMTGIDVFPAVPGSLKMQAAQLPEPHPHRHTTRENRQSGQADSPEPYNSANGAPLNPDGTFSKAALIDGARDFLRLLGR